MKYRIYGQFTGNTGDKSESIPWPFISIRASCVSSAWRITRTINTKPWWKWCCATRIPSRGSICSAITSRWCRQSRPWRPAWPAKAWRSLLTRGWNKHPASVPLVKLPCGWKKTGGTGIPPRQAGFAPSNPLLVRPYHTFTAGNVGFSDDIYTFPYFCAFLLKRYLAGEQSGKL